jgi:hypothetical protein
MTWELNLILLPDFLEDAVPAGFFTDPRMRSDFGAGVCAADFLP